jgi:hypothetical protein
MPGWLVEASNAQIGSPVSAARMTMPLLKTSRSPRRPNCRGRYPSWPRMNARIGKPLKAVLAARTSR